MPNPDVAVPSLPEPARDLLLRAAHDAQVELGRIALRLAKDAGYRHRAAEDVLSAMDAIGALIDANLADRAACRASAEPEGKMEREKTVIGLDYDGTITRDPDMWFAVMKLMQDFGHEVHIVTMRHGVESLMGGSPMERRFLEGANGVHFTGNSATGDRDAKRPHMDAKGIEVHVWIDDNPKAVHMSAREIWGWCTQPGDAMIHSAPEIPTPTASIAPKAEGEAEKWTEWNGGEMPVADWQVVEYRLRQGGLSFFNSAGGLFWHHDGKGDDIVAYRLPSQGIAKCAAPVAQAAVRASEEVLRLRQGLWDVYAALGFDTDGDPTPVALVSDIVELVVNAAKEARQDYDDAICSPNPEADADRASGGGV